MSQFKNTYTNNNSPKSILVKKSPRRLILNGNCEASNKLLDQQDQLYHALNDLTAVFNDFKVEVDNKLESFDINQRNSFNKYQNILNDGDYNLKLSMRKIINKEDIEDEESERNKYYRYDFNELIDQKIREYNRFREEEEIRKKIENEEDEKRRLDLISKIEMDRVYKYLTGNNNKYVIENLKPLQVIGKKLPVIKPNRKEKSENKSLSNESSHSKNRTESKNRIIIHFNTNNSKINNNNLEHIYINPNINNEKEFKNRNENIKSNTKTNKSKKTNKNKNDNNNENEKKEESKKENTNENKKENKEEKKEENTEKNEENKEEMNSEREIVTLRTPRTILNYSEDDEEEEEEGN